MDIVVQDNSNIAGSVEGEAGENEPHRQVPIAGIQAMTTIDFPEKLAAVLFLQGCPWNCRYCHNPELQGKPSTSQTSWDKVDKFVTGRVDFLEGIVISGGEPTMHRALPDLLSWLRSFGYKTALHTNGFYSSMLRRVLMSDLVDYIAMDIKGPPASYDRIAGVKDCSIEVARSIELITASDIDYEFRTTYHPDILSEDELMDTIHAVSSVGAKRYYLQQFRNNGVADSELADSCDTAILPAKAVEEARRLFEVFEVR